MFAQAMQMLSTTLLKAFPQPGMGQQAVPVQQPPAQAESSRQAQAELSDAFGSLPENITIHNLNELEEEQQ